MAYKKDIKLWLKDNNYTWEDMDKFWDECCVVNWKCNLLKQNGKNWTDLHMSQIEELPTLKEKTLQKLKEMEDIEKCKLEEKKKKEDFDRYYTEHFDEVILDKIDNNVSLTESELSKISDYSIERSYGDNRRWSRSVDDILEIDGRYFNLAWEEGLTESQENIFNSQPYEVFPYRSVDVIETTKYSKEKVESNIDECTFKGANTRGILKYIEDMLVQTVDLSGEVKVIATNSSISLVKVDN